MRTKNVLSFQGEKIIETFQQDAGITVFFAADRKDVEERGPNEVLNCSLEAGKPDRHGVVGIGWCRHDLDIKACDPPCRWPIRGDRWRYKPWRVWRMFCKAESQSEPDVGHRVQSRRGERETKLFDEAASIHRRNIVRSTPKVRHDPIMSIDGNVGAKCFKNRTRSPDIVEMRVHHRYDRLVADRGKLSESRLHLLNRLARINRDDAFWPFDEGLVRQTVADQTPDPRRWRVEFSGKPLRVIDQQPMGARARRCHDGSFGGTIKASNSGHGHICIFRCCGSTRLCEVSTR